MQPPISSCSSRRRSARHAVVGLLLLLLTPGLAGQGGPAMPPEAERQLAREIYKEMVEIKSGYTTGATTPVAEAVGAPAQGRRLPRRRHLRRRRDSDQGEPRRSLPRHRAQPAAAAARAHRRRRSEARRLEHGSVHVHREGRLLLRPRHRRRQGAGGGLDREPHSLQARRASSRTATSSSRSRPTKKAAGRTTASSGCSRTSAS